MRPFDALPGEMGQMLASMLSPVDFRRGELISGLDDAPARAHIVLEGEVDIEISGKHGATFGPGT